MTSATPIIPIDEAFPDSGFIASDDIEDVARRIINRFPELRHLNSASVGYLWKKKGGAKGGKRWLGKAYKPSGLADHYSGHDFVIVLAADECRDQFLTSRQFEALVYHELRHCEFDIETEKPSLVAHDLEVFIGEYQHYGAWEPGLAGMERAVRQLALPLDYDEDGQFADKLYDVAGVVCGELFARSEPDAEYVCGGCGVPPEAIEAEEEGVSVLDDEPEPVAVGGSRRKAPAMPQPFDADGTPDPLEP